MLIAEASWDGGTLLQMFVAIVTGGTLMKFFDWWANRKDKQAEREEKQADKARAERIDDESKAIQRLEDYCARQEEEIERLRQEVRIATRRANSAIMWIKHMEGRLDAKGEPYTPWVEGPNGEPVIKPPEGKP